MIALKKLILFLDESLKSLGPKDSLNHFALRKLTDDALTYLNTTKVLEYSGPIKLPGVALKLVDINMDLDDIIKEIVDKRTDIEFVGTISLIIEKVKKDETKTKAA